MPSMKMVGVSKMASFDPLHLQVSPVDTDPVEVYEVPTGKIAIFTGGNIANRTGAIVTCRLVISESGDNDEENAVLWDFPVPANDAQPLTTKYFLKAGSKIHFAMASGDALVLTMAGVLINA